VGISQFVALNRGRHLYSAGWPSRWVLAHILVSIGLSLDCFKDGEEGDAVNETQWRIQGFLHFGQSPLRLPYVLKAEMEPGQDFLPVT